MNPLVSIIIPTFNRAHLITETLHSVLAQTYLNWECIVVDDGSTDDTEIVIMKFVEKDNRFQFYKRPNTMPKGGNVCRNIGFIKSKGALIQWFDSDDLLLPHALEEKVNILQSDDDYCICAMQIFKGDISNVISTYNQHPANNIIASFLKDQLLLNVPSFLYRRATVAKFTFSESLTRAQDLDFVFRVITQPNLKKSWTPKVLLKVRLHEKSITSRFQQFEKNDLHSEIQVRKQVLGYAKGLPSFERNIALTKFLNVLKRLLKAKKYSWFNRELSQCPVATNSLKRKLRRAAYLYRCTGKGLALYGRIIKKHTEKDNN